MLTTSGTLDHETLRRTVDTDDFNLISGQKTLISLCGENAGRVDPLDAYQILFELERREKRAWKRCLDAAKQLNISEENLKIIRKRFSILWREYRKSGTNKDLIDSTGDEIKQKREKVDELRNSFRFASRPHAEIVKQIDFLNSQLVTFGVSRDS